MYEYKLTSVTKLRMFSDISAGQHHVIRPHVRETYRWKYNFRILFIESDCDNMNVIHLASLSQWLWWHMSLQQNIFWITWRHFCHFIYTSFSAILLLVGLLGIEQPGRDVHSPPSSTKVKMRRATSLLPLNTFVAWTGMSFTWRRFATYNWSLSLI